MLLQKIVTLANENTRLWFTVMERSLRATGCQLPLMVIPYNDDKFQLPANAEWVESEELFGWLDKLGCRGVYRKYWCLLQSNYLFVDSDVIFLKDPVTVLKDQEGFITCCGHWHNPGHTYTDQSIAILRRATTTWQKNTFNSGQFACSKALYSLAHLQETAASTAYADTCLFFKFHEQPGLNLLVHLSKSPVSNLTLPPYNMESTWAGDYLYENHEAILPGKNGPFLLHWAGRNHSVNDPVDTLYLNFMQPGERKLWLEKVENKLKQKTGFIKKTRKNLAILKHSFQQISWE